MKYTTRECLQYHKYKTWNSSLRLLELQCSHNPFFTTVESADNLQGSKGNSHTVLKVYETSCFIFSTALCFQLYVKIKLTHNMINKCLLLNTAVAVSMFATMTILI